MKFGALIDQKMIYQMTPRLFQSDIDFKVKLRSIFDSEFGLESNVGLE